MHSKTFLLLVFIKQLTAFFTGFHLGDYPPPDFIKTIKLSSQNNSFVEIEHFLGEIPFHVQVYAIANNGNNKGFKFYGTGACQNDGRDTNAYGGVIFAYDKTTVRVWTPTRMSGNKVGSVIFVGERWGGNMFSQDSLDAEVTIEAWKDGPVPSFQIETEVDAGLEKNTNVIYHDLHQIPEFISVRIFSGVDSENSYIFHASGVIQTSNIREYGGVIFSYNEKKVVLWTPNKPKTGCTLVNRRWGNGKYYNEMFSKTCKVHIRMWINSFSLPVFQTPWKSVYAGRTSELFLEIKHNLKMFPSYVKLQYRSVGQPYSLVFEGVGSVQSTAVSNSRHGGLVFAYDKVSVRIWLPTSKNKHQPYIIFVGDGWGNSDENVTESMAEFRVQIFLNRCLEAEKVVDSQGYCRDVSEIAIIQDMSAWGKCSNPCGKGLKQRSVIGCHGQSLQTIMNCQFNVDFCNFSNISWIRSNGRKEISVENRHLQIPFYGVKHGGYFVYSREGVLTSPELKDAKGCILLFKYSTGKYYGSLQIDILSNHDLWRENVWSMNDGESFGSNVWLTGYLNIGDLFYELKRFRFVHNPTKNFIPDPVSLTDIILKCEKSDEFKMTSEACREKEEMFASCLIDVFKPFSKGPAWSVSVPKNDVNKDLGNYVTSKGMYNDLIAKYKFQIMKSGSYQLWLESFAMNNDSNSVIVQINQDLTVADTIYNMRHGLWLPIIKEFHLRAGSYVIMLRQKDEYFSFKNMMLAPKKISVWGDLGMQSHHIPDSNFYSLNYPDDSLVYSRLNGRAGWMPTDRTIDRMFLEIRLPDIALINKIATQGGTWLDTAYPYFYCNIESYKIKFSLDGQNFAFYRNLTSKEIFKLEGNNNVSNLVVEHFFDFVLVAKSIRIYPSTIAIRLCLRAELYGYYITKGICPVIMSKAKEEVCQGDGQCENFKARCQIDPVNNQSVCLCKEGYHGNLCQNYGCTPNPCINDGVCVKSGNNIFCTCTPGFHGRYCQAVCPKGKYGRNCVFSCNCPEKNYCNPVDGSCQCEPGYHGIDCKKKCPENTYGQDCIFKCNCNKFMECDHVSGECLCKEGWKGIQCSSPCENGTFGRNCSQKCKCLNGGICNQTNGICDCTPGYYGQQCEHICDSNRWGENCTEYCEPIKNSTCDHITGHYACISGLMGTFCNVECPDGKFGENCMHSCACDIKNTEKCDKHTGHCVCKLGYRGERCDKLCENSWGYQCHNPCNCKSAVSCNPFTGECFCMDGFIGKQCEQECKEGYYGRNCSMKCSCEKKNTEKCETSNGYCKCQPGYTGASCTEACKEGNWGINCLENCLCVNNGKCDHRDGFCYCASGFHGQYCTKRCEHGTFGENCQQKCHCKNNTSCDNVDGHCICAPGFAGKFCEFKCPQGKYGENCSSNCNCSTFNTEDCDSVNGFCFCHNGFIGTLCEKECDDGFYGKRCKETCPVCFHSSNNICNKRFGNCSCADGFTGWNCLTDCDWSHFGHMCKQRCNCNPNELCSNINGQCYDSNLHLVTIKLRAPSQLFMEYELRQEIQRKFEIMMLHCFERLESLLLKSPTLNISDFTSCSMVGGEQMFDNDNLEHSSIYVMRIYNVIAMYVENEEIAALVFTLLRGTDPVNATFILDVISFIGVNAFSAGLNYEYYVGEASFDKQRDHWYSNTMYLAIAVSCVCTVLLFFVGFVIFCRRKSQSPSPFEKVRRESTDIELKSCLGNSKGHVYSFENPYYDVIAAMGLDDDIEEDYYNPLYMLDLQPDSDNEVDDMYYECQNNEYKSFLYDKDSGVSSATLA